MHGIKTLGHIRKMICFKRETENRTVDKPSAKSYDSEGRNIFPGGCPEMSELALWPLVGTAAAVLTAMSFVPQIIFRWRNPGQARVSAGTLAIFFLAAALWVAYGVYLKDRIIILANLVVLTNLVILTALQLWRKPQAVSASCAEPPSPAPNH
jgi:MtN3 and saliva related transmembrane protein